MLIHAHSMCSNKPGYSLVVPVSKPVNVCRTCSFDEVIVKTIHTDQHTVSASYQGYS